MARNTTEKLKRLGLLPRTEEELQRITQSAVAKVQARKVSSLEPHQLHALQRLELLTPEQCQALRWADSARAPRKSGLYVTNATPKSFAYVGNGLLVCIAQSESGKYIERHLFTLHTFTERRNAVLVNPDVLYSHWLQGHFTTDRAKLTEKFLNLCKQSTH